MPNDNPTYDDFDWLILLWDMTMAKMDAEKEAKHVCI
jgi:hypothetical protein